MSRLRLRVPSPALVVAVVALVMALGGTSYAAFLIGTRNIRNGAVTNAKLSSNAVGPAKIKNGGVTASKINTSGLTVPNATTANGVNGIQVVPGATLTLGAASLGNEVVTCPSGMVAISGNEVNSGGITASLNEVAISGNTVNVFLNNAGAAAITWRAAAVCVNGTSSGSSARLGADK